MFRTLILSPASLAFIVIVAFVKVTLTLLFGSLCDCTVCVNTARDSDDTMSFTKKDPCLFKSSKSRPIHQVTVPPPGSFTLRNQDAVASLLSPPTQKQSQSQLSHSLTPPQLSSPVWREEGGGSPLHSPHITIKTRAQSRTGSGTGSSMDTEQQARIAARNERAISKHQLAHSSRSHCYVCFEEMC